MEYLGEEVTGFLLSLALEEECFGLVGGDMGVAIGDEGLASDFSDVATDGQATGLDGEPNGDFDNGELGPLGSVSVEDKSDASLVILTALPFFFNPLWISGEGRPMTFIAIEAATGWVAEGGVGGVLLFARLDTITAALGAFSDLFMVAPPWVPTDLRDEKNKQSKNKYREKEEDGIETTKQCDLGISEQLRLNASRDRILIGENLKEETAIRI